MRRLLACSGLVTAIAAASWLGSGLAAAQAPVRVLEVRLGDQIRVVDAPIGCQVIRMRELGGRIALDCRRAGALANTYGTLLTSREAAVMRFQSKSKAKLVVVATHEGGVRQCK
jgi:hypothetical protein